MKKLYQSKTFWAGIAAIFTGVGITAASGWTDWAPMITAVTGLVMIVLRLMTSESIG